MRGITFVCLFILATSLRSAAADPTAANWRPDFATINHFALLNQSVRYDSTAAIVRTWSTQFHEIYIGDIRRTRNRYFVGVDGKSRVQDIAIRGTANMRNALYDLRFLKSFSPTLGISVFHGFEMMADVLYANLGPFLRRDYSVRISGQSLGAAEAVILGMILRKEGYRVEQIVTFGQPKVTDAAGAEAFDTLPLLRVADLNDIVPLLPPARVVYRDDPYVHFGREVVLLEGKHYCIADQAFADRPVPASLIEHLTRGEIDTLLHEHNIKSYVASIAPKLTGAVRVPCSESARYLPAPDRLPR